MYFLDTIYVLAVLISLIACIYFANKNPLKISWL